MTDRPRIADYMTRDIIALSPRDEITQAVQVLLSNQISGAPVLENGALVGILSQKDCLRAALDASYYRDWGGEVSAFMSTDLVTLDPGLALVAAAQRFVETPFRLIPVVDGGQLVGVLSRSDVLRALADNWSAT